MVPTLPGRLQTRVFLFGTVGVIVTALLAPLLPIPGPLGAAYKITYLILAAVVVVGIVWELIYHMLMQWRWEKDWPSLFGLVTGVPEGIAAWLLLAAHAIPGIGATPPFAAFLIDFIVVWLAVWLVAQGPMRVPFIRWRFHGGRLV
jgi:hypothetical protein